MIKKIIFFILNLFLCPSKNSHIDESKIEKASISFDKKMSSNEEKRLNCIFAFIDRNFKDIWNKMIEEIQKKEKNIEKNNSSLNNIFKTIFNINAEFEYYFITEVKIKEKFEEALENMKKNINDDNLTNFFYWNEVIERDGMSFLYDTFNSYFKSNDEQIKFSEYEICFSEDKEFLMKNNFLKTKENCPSVANMPIEKKNSPGPCPLYFPKEEKENMLADEIKNDHNNNFFKFYATLVNKNLFHRYFNFFEILTFSSVLLKKCVKPEAKKNFLNNYFSSDFTKKKWVRYGEKYFLSHSGNFFIGVVLLHVILMQREKFKRELNKIQF